MNALRNSAKMKKKKVSLISKCIKHFIRFFENMGFTDCGLSDSVNGGVIWYDKEMK